MKNRGDAPRPRITHAEVSRLVGLTPAAPASEPGPKPNIMVASPPMGTPPTQQQTNNCSHQRDEDGKAHLNSSKREKPVCPWSTWSAGGGGWRCPLCGDSPAPGVCEPRTPHASQAGFATPPHRLSLCHERQPKLGIITRHLFLILFPATVNYSRLMDLSANRDKTPQTALASRRQQPSR